MKVEQIDNITVIKDTKIDLINFLMNLTIEYKTFEKFNLIIDLSLYENITTKQFNSFLPIIKIHKKTKKSFVIVANAADFNDLNDNIIAVPTKLEALDIIKMDEIERDLGF